MAVLLSPGIARRRSALAAKPGACRQLHAATGTFASRQGSTALLEKARFVRIGAATLGARIAGIAPAWAAALRIAWITTVAAVSGTAAMVAALIAAVVASESAAH